MELWMKQKLVCIIFQPLITLIFTNIKLTQFILFVFICAIRGKKIFIIAK